MHIKIQLSATLPTHRVARSVWVPESYTIHELSRILQASLGWVREEQYLFSSDDGQWGTPSVLTFDDPEVTAYLSEGTSLSEVLMDWKERPVRYSTGARHQWEFSIEVQAVMESHPANMTCMFLDGHGDMPVETSELRTRFLSDLDILVDRKTKADVKYNLDQTLSLCAERVQFRSIDISSHRQSPAY